MENAVQAGAAVPENFIGRLVTCPVDELQAHPSYLQHQLRVPASKLSALADKGDLPFREPLVITRERKIIDGYGAGKVLAQYLKDQPDQYHT